MIQQWDCLMTFIWLKGYLLILHPLQMSSETTLFLKKSSYQYCSSSEKQGVSAEQHISKYVYPESAQDNFAKY